MTGTGGASPPQLLIDGRLRGAADGATFPILSPATGAVIGAAPDAADEDCGAAVAAARRAFDETGWSRDSRLRAHCLRQLKAALDNEYEVLRDITIAEAGAPRMWVDGPQLRAPIDGLDYLTGLLETYEWEQDLGRATPLGLPASRRLYREAIGVVAAITPWNFPNQINLAKLGPALAAGCTVILNRPRTLRGPGRSSAASSPPGPTSRPAWSTC